MLVKEIVNELDNMRQDGKLKNQTVEFVFDSKKYYAHDIKSGVDTMAFEVTRKSYRELTLSEFEKTLKESNPEHTVSVVNSDANKPAQVTGLFCGLNFIEVSLEA